MSATAATTNHKGDFYTNQLDLALAGGQWTSNTPAKGIGGVAISWAELLRKFRKHCPNQSVTAEVAASVHALSLLGLRSSPPGSELEADDRSLDGQLDFNSEAILPAEAREEAQAAYDKLNALSDKSTSVRSTLGFFSYTLGRPQEAIDHLKHASLADADTRSQWALVERIRSLTITGLAHEALGHPDAISPYKTAIAALPAPPPTTINPPTELARWSERALWRFVCLTVTDGQSFDQVLDALRTYLSHSARWPAPFRPRHRSTLLRLHLHVLSLNPPPSWTSSKPGRLQWLHETRTTVSELRSVLTGSMSFPGSGKRNIPVEKFVDTCVRLWEVGGANADQADWVIDVMYWAMRYTFNSTRIMRHMTRLLAASGDISFSKRILDMYVKLMQHARKASDSSRNHDTNGTTNGDILPPPPEDGSDSDALFLHTVVQGIRMICRTGHAEDAAPLVPVLDEIFQRCHLPAEQMVEARNAAGLAKSVWNIVAAAQSHSHEARSKHLDAAREALAGLTGPSAAYHRALLLSLDGAAKRSDAVAAAREAVEGAPRDVRVWHLLGLLLAAEGDFNAAREILEIGATACSPPAPEDEAEPAIDTATLDVLEGWNQEWNGWPLEEQEDWAKRDEREDALQLRMTQVAIIEAVLGPEGASNRWLEVFTWWSQVFPTETASSHQTPEIPSLALTRTITPTLEIEEPQQQLEGLRGPAIELIPPSPAEEPSSGLLSPDGEKRDSKDREDKDKLLVKMRREVVKGRERIDTISKKIVVGVQGRARSNSESQRQRRSSAGSALDFGLVLSRTNSYQASSIHSRRGQIQGAAAAGASTPQLGSPFGTIIRRRSPSPPPPPPPPAPSAEKEKAKGREKREKRLRSELWLMSAASFRRQGRLEHARGAIQYAEACDANNANVFTQLGLLHVAQHNSAQAGHALDKALMLDPDNVQALIHRAKLYLDHGEVDLAEGMLTGLVSGLGWATPEAWFVRAQAAGKQGRQKEQRAWLERALFLCEGRGIREVGDALGWCL
ncbi:hypothetical protein BKA62DRAFT_750276 [Auriculariales sp. MPI-PUGE-AT-0066]|nr:hypothetical protein BKA62DRAFT_750276 [Auriculariales sp. MPI-PUGE-AT-0066]